MNPFESVKHTVYRKRNGLLESIQVHEEMRLESSVGELVPVYKTEDFGRKKLMPVRFDKNGNIRSVPLQETAEVETSCGTFRAELLTFYPDGALCRLFPLNGKLSGYWSETNEYELARVETIPTPIGEIKVKPLYLHFYETGELKSLTFWPKERVTISTPLGEMKIRRGVSFYRNGALASCEPASPEAIETPLGTVSVFDPDPNGMNGEKNSLQFDETGEILSFSTTEAEFRIQDPDYGPLLFQPDLTPSMCSDTVMVRQALYVDIEEDQLQFRSMGGIIGRTSRQNRIDLVKLEPVTVPQVSCSA